MIAGRRTFLAALAFAPPPPSPSPDPSLLDFSTTASNAFVIQPIYVPRYRCPVHGELTPASLTSLIGEWMTVIRHSEPDRINAGPVCIYCAVDFLKRSCPPLEKIG